MDRLTDLISTRRADLQRAEERENNLEEAVRVAAERYLEAVEYREKLAVELKALVQADELRPAASAGVLQPTVAVIEPPSSEGKRGGRQPGAISKRWREALSWCVATGNPPRSAEAFQAELQKKLGLTEASVRERVRHYTVTGFLIEQGGCYRVSEAAIRKFHLMPGSGSPTEVRDTLRGYPRAADDDDNEKAPH